MIRNVVMGRLSSSATAEQRAQLQTGLTGIAELEPNGCLAMHTGMDASLREGNWDFAITNDWIDADAYRAYDKEREHNRFRTMIAEVCETLARVQFDI